MRVLFVCLGNICRSPAAEGLLRARCPDWIIDSAGTSDWHLGAPPYAPMQAAARRRGLHLGDQRARQIVPDDFRRFDHVLALDAAVLSDLRAMQGGALAKLFGTMAGLDGADVPDPYYTRDFDGCLDMIASGLPGLQAQLRSATSTKLR
ncbi:MAG: low molecular weight protein-tyrosine-phosphatase [Jannaschia sp.]